MNLPVRPLPVAQNWDCHVSGSCCKEYRIPLSPDEARRIEEQGWTPEELGGRTPFRTTGWLSRQTLAQQPGRGRRLRLPLAPGPLPHP